MGLNYSQRRLLGNTFHKKGSGGHATLSPMRRKKSWKGNLETYAFATGLLSTIISLAQVIIMASK